MAFLQGCQKASNVILGTIGTPPCLSQLLLGSIRRVAEFQNSRIILQHFSPATRVFTAAKFAISRSEALNLPTGTSFIFISDRNRSEQNGKVLCVRRQKYVQLSSV